MARLDLFRSRGSPGLLLDVQAETFRSFDTRVVIPLLPAAAGLHEVSHLNPIIQFDGRRYAMETQWLASVPLRRLGRPVGRLLDHEDQIIRALDALFTGF